MERETEMWNQVALNENWNNDADESVEKLYRWITERLKFCDSNFESKYNLGKKEIL